MRELGRSLMLLGGVLVVLGAVLWFGDRLPFRLGQLPGDIAIRGKHGSFYFPLMTCLLISVMLSVIGWLMGRR